MTYEGEGPLWKPHLTFSKQALQCTVLFVTEGQVQRARPFFVMFLGLIFR